MASPSIPPFPFDTYQRYKFGTSVFVSWLGEAARKCGYFAQQSTEPSNKPAKTKWTVRKAAKKRSKETPASLLTLTELPLLAEIVANSDTEIPLSVVVVLKQVIKARTQCARFYTRQNGDQNPKGPDASHEYAIEIFKRVLDILTPSADGGEANGKKTPIIVDESGHKVPIDFTNSFEGLKIEDPASDLEDYAANVQSINAKTKKKQKSGVRSYEMEDPLADYMMEIFFFFSDLNEVRSYLQQLWRDYQDGKVDLSSVSVTTDLALEMIQKNEQDFLQSFRDGSKEIDDMMTGLALHHFVCQDNKLDHEDLADRETWECANFVYYPTYRLMKGYLSNLRPPHQMTVLPATNMRDIIPKRDRESLSLEQKYLEDRDILFALLPDIGLLFLSARHDPFKAFDTSNMPVGWKFSNHDRVSCGLQEAQNSGKIPIWLVFGVQNILDIFHITRNSSGRGLAEVRLTAKRVQERIKAYREFSRYKWSSSWDSMKESLFDKVEGFVQRWVDTDRIGNLRDRVSPDIGKRHPFWLLTYHPMFCGAIIFTINLNMQIAGRVLSSSWGAISACIHLYSASRKWKNLNKELWQDMEFLISIHGEEFLFFGGAPKKPYEFLKKFYMSLGNSIQVYARNRRAPDQGIAAPQRQLTAVDSISKLLTYRYLDSNIQERDDKRNPSEMFTIGNIEKVLTKSTLTKSAKSSLSAPRTETRYKGGLSKAQKHHKKSSRLSPLQFLDALCVAISDESTILSFDYLGMHIRCLRLLREIHTECRDALIKLYKNHKNEDIRLEDNFGTDEALAELPIYIFRHAAEMELTVEEMKWRDGGDDYVSSVFQEVSGVIERMCKAEGSDELNKVVALRKGVDAMADLSN